MNIIHGSSIQCIDIAIRIILLNPKFAIKYVFMVISSSPYESGCPNDVKCALPAKRLDEEGAEGEVDNHADGGAHHRPGYKAAALLYGHPPEDGSFNSV